MLSGPVKTTGVLGERRCSSQAAARGRHPGGRAPRDAAGVGSDKQRRATGGVTFQPSGVAAPPDLERTPAAIMRVRPRQHNLENASRLSEQTHTLRSLGDTWPLHVMVKISVRVT